MRAEDEKAAAQKVTKPEREELPPFVELFIPPQKYRNQMSHNKSKQTEYSQHMQPRVDLKRKTRKWKYFNRWLPGKRIARRAGKLLRRKNRGEEFFTIWYHSMVGKRRKLSRLYLSLHEDYALPIHFWGCLARSLLCSLLFTISRRLGESEIQCLPPWPN